MSRKLGFGVPASAGGTPTILRVLTIFKLPAVPRFRAGALVFIGLATLLNQAARGDAPEEYRWRPFAQVTRPPVPAVAGQSLVRNPIDAFVAEERDKRRLAPRPPASKQVLLRRVYLDLIGLSPTPKEQAEFEEDRSAQAYEKVVDRLLADARYGERWGRHWMDVWRYSDWAGWSGGNQIRDSQPHIWRWRDWIIESLNEDKGYDRMVKEMLAADEIAPADPNALRATGYLVRNFKLLSREQWLDDTIKHTSQAFLGVTLGCAKCHDHKYDPILQSEYYQVRAIFEPHQVRTDRVPGELDRVKDGLVRVFDSATNRQTFLLVRGDERRPDTNQVIVPGVPKALLGPALEFVAKDISLPALAAFPDKRAFVISDSRLAADKAVTQARTALDEAMKKDDPGRADKIDECQLKLSIAEAARAALEAVLRAEELDDAGQKESEAGREAAAQAVRAQRQQGVMEARLKFQVATAAEKAAARKVEETANAGEQLKDPPPSGAEKEKSAKEAQKAAKDLEAARKAKEEADKGLAAAEADLAKEPGTSYKPRPAESFPAASSGRRLALARWIADSRNPLTARVAMNHIWQRHFGRGIVATPADFGHNGSGPSHPKLLDWLASEFMAQGWSMKAMHRLIVTSATYRMASTSDPRDASTDPDNIYLWRMPSRRMEAELVRDNLLWIAGDLDLTMGGPEIDHNLGLTSRRRSLYLRTAAEKEVEFLKIFDGPNVTECYQRRPTVMPQQALALANSELAFGEARALARKLSDQAGDDDAEFVRQAFGHVLARPAKPAEFQLCRDFLQGRQGQAGKTAEGSSDPASVLRAALPQAHEGKDPAFRSRENLMLVLFNHNDFLTIR